MKQANHQASSEFQTKDIYLATVIKQAGIPIVRIHNSGGRGGEARSSRGTTPPFPGASQRTKKSH